MPEREKLMHHYDYLMLQEIVFNCNWESWVRVHQKEKSGRPSSRAWLCSRAKAQGRLNRNRPQHLLACVGTRAGGRHWHPTWALVWVLTALFPIDLPAKHACKGRKRWPKYLDHCNLDDSLDGVPHSQFNMAYSWMLWSF